MVDVKIEVKSEEKEEGEIYSPDASKQEKKEESEPPVSEISQVDSRIRDSERLVRDRYKQRKGRSRRSKYYKGMRNSRKPYRNRRWDRSYKNLENYYGAKDL